MEDEVICVYVWLYKLICLIILCDPFCSRIMTVMLKLGILLTVCLSVFSFNSFLFFSLLPLLFICSVLPSLLLIRMGHVPAGTGRRLCPSAAACQRRRLAVLQTASTPWWVSYSLTLYITSRLHIPLHETVSVLWMCRRLL